MMKGTFVDEKILQLKEIYRKKRDYDITKDEVYIRENWIHFIPFMMFDGQVKVLIPENFFEMPDNIARVRYVNQFRPPVILTSKNYSENLLYHLLERGERDLDQSIQQMQEVILLHAPETVLYENGSFTAGEAEGRWFEYKNFTVDDETYQLQFLLGTESCLLVGTFNCRMMFYDEWKAPILKSLEYISIQEGEEK